MAKRVSFEIPGFSHKNPIPAASQIGPYLYTGVLTGRDPETRELPETLAGQMTHIFNHVRALMAEAGGSPDDIVKMTFWLENYRDREALNREWAELFPDPANRPARQVMATYLDDGVQAQCDFVAVLPVTTTETT